MANHITAIFYLPRQKNTKISIFLQRVYFTHKKTVLSFAPKTDRMAVNPYSSLIPQQLLPENLYRPRQLYHHYKVVIFPQSFVRRYSNF